MPSRREYLGSVGSAALAVTAGCAGWLGALTAYRSYGYGPRNRGRTAATGPTEGVEVAWRAPDALPDQVPAVVDGRVFAAVDRQSRGVVAAFDTGSGEQRWSYDAGAPLTGWRPAVADGSLYFLDRSGTAHAVATDDGSRQWRRSLPEAQGQNSPVVVDGALVFGLGRQDLFRFGGLYALETTDGSTRWHLAPADDGGRTHTPAYPAAVDGTVYYASLSDGSGPTVVAVSATDGSTEWTASPTGARYTGVAVTGDRFYLGGPRAQAAVGRERHEAVWTLDAGALFTPPTVGTEGVYTVGAGAKGPGLRALAPDGSERWRHTPEGDPVATPSAATAADGTVHYAASDGRLYALDATSGERRWRFGAERPGVRTPAVVDGTVYAASSNGLVALRSS